MTGWKPEGHRPEPKQYVLIAAPHTTNWDFLYLIAFAWLFDMKISFMAKHTLFWPPLGWIMRAFGGLPVERHKRTNLVTALAGLFDEHEELALVVPAEGTRGYVEHWKSGFYHIARQAEVPVFMAYLDASTKTFGYAPPLRVTGDVRADMDHIRAFYADKRGLVPEHESVIRLREEEDAAEKLV